MDNAKVFLLIGPSGVGKNTIQDLLLADYDLVMARGCWTRQYRPNETKDTADSDVVTHEQFLRMYMRGELTVANEVHGNFYGTPKRHFTEPLSRGKNVIRIVTADGADRLRDDLPEIQAVTIFLVANLDVLRDRLERRGDTPEAIERRLKTAEYELTRQHEFDYLVSSATPAEAVYEQVRTIFDHELGLNFSHRPGEYQLCPCDDCQERYPHTSNSKLLELPEYQKGWVRLPYCHQCDDTVQYLP